jgi:hypothetical protein
MALDSKVWGPYYWFVLHTIALSYPLKPNEVTKRKYYEFIQNLPIFLPNSDIGDNFSKLLNNYPVTPYLDSRSSFIKWMHFIHNKINVSLSYPELSLDDAMIAYYEHYKPKEVKNEEQRKQREKYVFLGFIIIIIGLGWRLYKQ